mmetsp:Transcript_19965/g.37548  ORF Transcript_19965/g.37548 Transcript_19965/m.37548 type:complete len:308 (-) Transcript_19965:131-1054(-)
MVRNLDDLMVSDDDFWRRRNWHIDVLDSLNNVCVVFLMVLGTSLPKLVAAILPVCSGPNGVVTVFPGALICVGMVIHSTSLVDDFGRPLHLLGHILFDLHWNFHNLLVVDDFRYLDFFCFRYVLIVDSVWRPVPIHRHWLLDNLGWKWVRRHLDVHNERLWSWACYRYMIVVGHLDSDGLGYRNGLVLCNNFGRARNALLPTTPCLVLCGPQPVLLLALEAIVALVGSIYFVIHDMSGHGHRNSHDLVTLLGNVVMLDDDLLLLLSSCLLWNEVISSRLCLLHPIYHSETQQQHEKETEHDSTGRTE